MDSRCTYLLNYQEKIQDIEKHVRLFKLMTQERIFSIIINQTKKGTNKAWMVSHDMMLTCHMHEGIPLELNPVLKLLEMRKGCWWAICTTCVVSLSNEHMSRCDPFSTTMMMTTIMHKYIPVE